MYSLHSLKYARNGWRIWCSSLEDGECGISLGFSPFWGPSFGANYCKHLMRPYEKNPLFPEGVYVRRGKVDQP